MKAGWNLFRHFVFLPVLFLLSPGWAQQNPHGNLNMACEDCHSGTDWHTIVPGKFNHTQTGFSLDGVHRKTACFDCHQSLIFSDARPQCISCHTDVHKGELGNACEDCHSPQTWQNDTKMRVYHEQLNFPLTGVHANLDCASCHTNEQQRQYANTPVECAGCHLDNFMRTINPQHQKVGFSTKCETCHLLSDNDWRAATYAHTARFPLVGGHGGLQCEACHGAEYKALSIDCWNCHDNNYRNAKDPDHQAGGFNHDCTFCHNINAWSPADFNHDNTGFPLTGAHQSLDCISCHANGYINTPKDCWSCHAANYTAATDPDHTANNFSHQCETCHSTSAWSPATFDHSQTSFPLTGAHANINNCVDCHSNGYSNTPTACVACHQQNYDASTDPNHRAAGFPTTCEQCHSTSAWSPANWDHDSQYFPIYSGKHRGEWNVCSDCHVDAADYKRFECINCHEHDRSRTDSKHSGVSGYSYNSAACYNCHPTGSEEGGDD